MNCTVDKCEKEALYTFVWPWGANGACCEHHKIIVLQKSQQLRGSIGGRVAFVPLNPDRPREITRDERVELHAARLTAEAERDEARLRSSKLFEANTGLTNELRQVNARCSHYHATVIELRDQVEALVRERDAAMVAAERAREEAARLGVVVGTGDDIPFGAPRHVVEGTRPDETTLVDVPHPRT